ncbi:MAG: dTMP kinase [Pirellulales bacterium]
MFFSFDGIDGVGKTTQMELFCEHLRAKGLEVVECRDPGSTPLGERVREILLHSDGDTPIGRRAEMLLYMAARAQLVDEVIRPALAAGKTIVSDRYLLANLVYQGHAGGLDLEAIRQVGAVTVDGVWPDAVFVLDMDPAAADARMQRSLDRMERQGNIFRERLRAGFLAEAARSPNGIHLIDAARDVETIQTEIRQIAEGVLDG